MHEYEYNTCGNTVVPNLLPRSAPLRSPFFPLCQCTLDGLTLLIRFILLGGVRSQSSKRIASNAMAEVIRPSPNPAFVFPMQPEPDVAHSPAGLDSIGSNNSNRRAKIRSRPEHLSLPNFSFHPSSTSSETPKSATPSSPTKSQMISPHPGGHRRNGSEFIGGDGRNATTGLMSTSPTKGEGALPPPPGVRTGPPAGRRSHAHRRSGAISSHDVSTMLRPTEIRGGSAPTTPSNPSVQPILPPVLDRSISQPTTTLSSLEPSLVSHHRRLSSTAGQTRPRVGFSDHIEFIPRPLSTISSETSSSLSTIRPSHSVTGSISSIISNGNASPSSAKSARIPAVEALEKGMPTLDSSAVPGEESMTVLDANLVRTDLGTSVDMPSWSEVFKSPRSEREVNYSGSSDDASSILRLSGTPDTLRSRRRPVSSVHSPLARPRTSPEPKVSKRQRKVKSWAGSFLARKARNSMQGDLWDDFGLPQPPQPLSVGPDDLSFDQLNFDDDTSCVIDTAPSRTLKASPAKIGSPLSRAVESSTDSDSDEPDHVLDLDAVCVLTPSGPNFEEVTGSHGAGARRRMHSSGATGGFDGPGMHYHRRAESAPELAPVNRRLFNPSGLSSSTAMADVFEEDEDEEDVDQELDTKAPRAESVCKVKNDQTHGLGVSVVDTGNYAGSPVNRLQRPVTAPLSKDDSADSRTRNAPSFVPSFAPTLVSDPPGVVEVVGADEEPREADAMATKSSNDSAVTPTSAGDPFIARPISAPLQYALVTPHPAFATPETYSSALSTPDFSQTSFEGPRLHTATSSMTDRGTLSSSRAGDHGFDLRVSVDDVPSLTSSASTMASGYPPHISSGATTRTSADRTPSLVGAVAPRTRPGNSSKRSSLASLSRLVGGSHGERSKLNIEERAQPEDMEKNEKKKGRRLSRLMRFWKSKEKVASS